MALYIPHSIFLLARLMYVRPETFGPYYVRLNTQRTAKVFESFNNITVLMIFLDAL